MSTKYKKGKENPAVAPFLQSIARLRHPAPLVMYTDYKSKPVFLKDVGCDGPKDDKSLFSYSGYEYMKLDDEASISDDPVERETLMHMLTMQCLMYNRVKGFTTWKFEDA